MSTEPKPTAPVQYLGRQAKTGNSLGFRFEGALFKSHPEFNGKVRATVIAPGQLLVSADLPEDHVYREEDDPVLKAFLAFIDKDLAAHPEHAVPLDPKMREEIAALTKGVVVDPDEEFFEADLI